MMLVVIGRLCRDGTTDLFCVFFNDDNILFLLCVILERDCLV